MLDPHFVIVGAALSVLGTSSYVIATLRGKTRPNRVTWFLWTLAPMIAFVAQLGQGVGLVALMTFSAGFCPFMILVSSFVNRNSYWQVGRLDYACGALSALALVLWGITRTGNLAIMFSILADGLAAFPTLRKAFREPETEHSLAFVMAGVNAAITLLTVKTWTFAHYGFPTYILVICVTMVLVIRFLHRPIPRIAGPTPVGEMPRS